MHHFFQYINPFKSQPYWSFHVYCQTKFIVWDFRYIWIYFLKAGDTEYEGKVRKLNEKASSDSSDQRHLPLITQQKLKTTHDNGFYCHLSCANSEAMKTFMVGKDDNDSKRLRGQGKGLDKPHEIGRNFLVLQ